MITLSLPVPVTSFPVTSVPVTFGDVTIPHTILNKCDLDSASMLIMTMRGYLINNIVTWIFFFFDLFMVYMQECKQHLWNNTRKTVILNTLNPDCSFITLIEPYNNQRPRYDIARLKLHLHFWSFSLKLKTFLFFKRW